MSARDIAAAVSVAIVWGLSFIAIKVGVGETSPLMLAALRFLFAALPMVFFLSPPKAPVWAVVLYGFLIGVGQFGFLFIAIHQGFPVGLASLVIMAQVFFTILLAWLILGERPRRAQIIGAAVGFIGMAVIGSERLAGASLGPFLIVILAAAFWGAGNVLAKSVGKVDMLAFTVWSSLAAPLPLIASSLAIEGTVGAAALAHPGLKLIVSVLALSYGGTLYGYGVWTWLMAHHSAATVAPLALLVPVVGIIAGALLFGETLSVAEIFGGALVMAGLALNVFGDWALRRRFVALR
jgi:O-acetylserine/cysteine efflux transporter